MSRGVSKDSIVRAVLTGLGNKGDSAPEGDVMLRVAETIVREAQPCKVEIGLTAQSAPKARGASRIKRELRVQGLTGTTRATVSVLSDIRPSALGEAFTELLSGSRKRVDVPAYRILAMSLEDSADKVQKRLEAMQESLAETMGGSRENVDVYIGDEVTMESGKSMLPVSVVMSSARA